VKPEIKSEVVIGTHGGMDRVLVGRLAETGGNKPVYFDATKEFVTLIVGKRGSGKSYALGSFLEGFATENVATDIGSASTRRAVLLLDPMGNFWPSAIPVAKDGPPKVKRQYDDLRKWRIAPPDVNVRVWMPAGFQEISDFPGIEPLHVDPSDLDDQDWADILGINLIRDPQGVLLADAYDQLRQTAEGVTLRYTIDDLIHAADAMLASGAHAGETVRALKRSLGSYARLELFRGAGTPLTELLCAGQFSVLMLPVRVGHDLRGVLTRMLIRRILRDREMASHISQRLQVENLSEEERRRLATLEKERVPRTVVALDEAQELLGEGGGDARRALEDFCLLGRNYGLSLVLATQRPTAAAISPKVRSQVDTYIVHRLLTQEDIDLFARNLLAHAPAEIRNGMAKLDMVALLRQLGTGQAVVSSSHVEAEPEARTFVMDVRPRVTVHGGEVF
jgi:DNA helicase HerA-like ATPase